MTEHKFTDEEIIKALESKAEAHCAVCEIKGIVPCEHCIFHYVKNAVVIINRQKEEIEVIKETTAEIRYEAVKEFAEYLKKYYRHIDKTAGALIEYTIDAKLKEFLEGVSGAADSQDND